jgi:type II secretory ATPase GspE/PulE/Tfp pilus assembly ATPase PilB-like protein
VNPGLAARNHPTYANYAITSATAEFPGRFLPLAEEYGRERLGEDVFGARENPVFYTPGGCGECGGTGYSGRVALYGVCMGGEELRKALAEGAGVPRARAVLARGAFGLRLDAVRRVFQGFLPLWGTGEA